MRFVKAQDFYIIRLFKGEQVVEKLTRFCEEENINSGILHGLGGALSAELGFYNLENKEYIFKKFDKLHEIVSLTGNVALVDKKPFLHIHAVLSDENFECFGGHLKEALVGATCEIYIMPAGGEIERILDDNVGLKLLNCPSEFF